MQGAPAEPMRSCGLDVGHIYLDIRDIIWLTRAVAAVAEILVPAPVFAGQSASLIATDLQCGSASVPLTPARTGPAAPSWSSPWASISAYPCHHGNRRGLLPRRGTGLRTRGLLAEGQLKMENGA